jgi:hypothetical protein
MIPIPQGEKGACPKCGQVYGLAEYHLERGKVQTKAVGGLR